MRRYATFILAHRALFSALLLGSLAASISILPRLRLQFSVNALWQVSAAERREIAGFEAAMPPRTIDFVITLGWSRRVMKSDLAAVAALTERLQEVEGVAKVLSLATTNVVTVQGGIPRPRRFADLISGENVLASAREHPLLMGRLLSHDGQSLAVLVVLEPRARTSGAGLSRTISALASEHAPESTTLNVLGSLMVEQVMARAMYRDMQQSLLLQLVCSLLILALLFRSVRGVVIPLVVILVAVMLFGGIVAASGGSLTLIEVTVPGLIIIIGLCDAIHMVHRFEEARASGLDSRAAVLEMMDKVGVACLFTTVTTAIGFLGLVAAEHHSVRDFAFTAALGIGVAFAVVITAIPLLLSVWPGRKTGRARSRKPLRIPHGRPRLAAVILTGVVVFSVWGVTRIAVESRLLEELSDDHPVARTVRWYQTHFEGPLYLDVYLVGTLQDPEVFQAVRALETRVVGERGVTSVESYTGWVDEMLGHPKDLDSRRIARGLGFLALSGEHFPSHALTRDFRQARLRFRVRDVGTSRFLELAALLDGLGDKLPESVQARVGGYGRIAFESARLLVATTLESLLLSLVLIVLLMAAIFRSLRIAWISIVPNAVPVLLALGLAGWLGIPLRLGIVMIFSLGVGLAVDDSIHLITRYRQELAAHPDVPSGTLLSRSLDTCGRALITTSAVLTIGMLCYLPASFRSLNEIGILLPTIVVSALVANLFVLPLMLERWDKRRG